MEEGALSESAPPRLSGSNPGSGSGALPERRGSRPWASPAAALIGLALLLAAARWIAADPRLQLPCLFHAIVGAPCPLCGGTRALAALAEGRLADAFGFHPLAAAAACAAALRGLWGCARALLGKPTGNLPLRARLKPFLTWRLFVALLLANWLFLLLRGS